MIIVRALSFLFLFFCVQGVSAVAMPDQLISRTQAEDPTLELTGNPLKKLRGYPRELFVYKCSGSCEETAYKHIKLDRKGRVTYIRVSRHVREFEYGNVHDMPVLLRDDMWGDGNFDKKEYFRDNFGNIIQVQYSDAGLVRNNFFKTTSGFTVKRSHSAGSTVEVYQNGLISEFLSEGLMDFIRSDGSSYKAHGKSFERYIYGYHDNGSLEKIERIVGSERGGESVVSNRHIKYFNVEGFIVAELYGSKGTEYIDLKVDSKGNLVFYKLCNVAGGWGKYSSCQAYETKISYY